ncbi:MAG: hypothetical protein AAGE52_17185 [Myxococcota bacterium]
MTRELARGGHSVGDFLTDASFERERCSTVTGEPNELREAPRFWGERTAAGWLREPDDAPPPDGAKFTCPPSIRVEVESE